MSRSKLGAMALYGTTASRAPFPEASSSSIMWSDLVIKGGLDGCRNIEVSMRYCKDGLKISKLFWKAHSFLLRLLT